MSKIELSISLLAGGKSAYLEKCLKSLMTFKDKLSTEIIIVDTGCSAQDRKIIENYGDKIVDFTWCNDFSKARNAGLEKASGEWFLFIDDDEWFEDTTSIIEFLKSKEAGAYNQGAYKIRNYSDLSAKNYMDEWNSRMIRRTSETHFESRIHEQLLPATGKCKAIDAYVHHFGYAEISWEKTYEKYLRNETLLLEIQKEEPNNIRWPYHLLKEYEKIGDGEKLLKISDETILKIQHENNSFMNGLRAVFYCGKIRGYVMQNKIKEANDAITEVVKDERNTSQALAAIYEKAVESAEKGKRYDLVIDYAKNYEKNLEAWMSTTCSEQERIIQESYYYLNAVNHDVVQRKVIYKKLRAMNKLGRMAEVTERDKVLLEGYFQNYLSRNEQFLLMPKEVLEAWDWKVVDFEKMLLKLDIEKWLTSILFLKSGSMQNYRDCYLTLCERKTCKNVRYDILEIYYAEKYLVNISGREPLAEIKEYMQILANAGTEYCKFLYSPEVYENDSEYMTALERSSLWMNLYLSLENKEYSERLFCIRKIVDANPSMAKVASCLISELKKQQETDSRNAALTDEMKQLIQELKQKVYVLLEQGMTKEACEIVQQLLKFDPKDTELLQIQSKMQQIE